MTEIWEAGLSLLDRCRCIMNSEMSHPPLRDWAFMYIHESTEEYGGKHHPEQATACPGARPLPSCLHLSAFAPIALGHAVLLCGSVCSGIIIRWHIHSIFSTITLCACSYRMVWINSKKENYIILVRSFNSIEWRSLHVVVSTWYSSKHALTYIIIWVYKCIYNKVYLPPTAPRAQQHKWLPTAPGVCSRCVCVHFGWVNCRAQIPSMGNHTWPHVTSRHYINQ